MLLIALRALLATTFGRLRRGPLRPSWSWRFELFTRVLKFRAAMQSRQSIADRRAGDEQMANVPADLRKHLRYRSISLGGVPCAVVEPGSVERTLLFLHGGGFIGGSANTHGDLIARLALLSHARVVVPEYRLAPEHSYPAAHDDVLAVWRALQASEERVGSIAVAGDSAGGTLAIALLLALREAGEEQPSCAVLLSPWVDMTERGGSMRENARYDWAEPEDFDQWVQAYARDADPTQPALSPLNADLRGLPPMLIEVGTAEMLLDQVRAFAARAREAGVDVTFRELPDMVHNSYLLAAFFPERERDVERLGDWTARFNNAPSPERLRRGE